MGIRFDEIDKTLSDMTEEQLRLTLQNLALVIKLKGIVDKFGYIDAVKLGLTWPK